MKRVLVTGAAGFLGEEIVNYFNNKKYLVLAISHRNKKYFNKRIIQKKIDLTKKFKINFSPDLIIFGHVFNVESRIFDYCKSNNILTANWFIDSISKEFLNGKKKINFMNLVNKVDKTFITSSP